MNGDPEEHERQIEYLEQEIKQLGDQITNLKNIIPSDGQRIAALSKRVDDLSEELDLEIRLKELAESRSLGEYWKLMRLRHL